MNWINRKLDKISDAWTMRNVEEVEVYGDEKNGYILEYGDKVREFDNSGQLIGFYNDRIRDRLDLEPVSVIGNLAPRIEEQLHQQQGYSATSPNGEWGVDIFNTVTNYGPYASKKAVEDTTVTTVIEPGQPVEEQKRQFQDYMKEVEQLEDVDPIEAFEHHIVNALSGAVTQAVTLSQTGPDEGVRLEYLIQELEEL